MLCPLVLGYSASTNNAQSLSYTAGVRTTTSLPSRGNLAVWEMVHYRIASTRLTFPCCW